MKSWKHLLFEEESKKWQYNGGDDMAVDHNDEGINATGGYWLYQNHVYRKEEFDQGEEQVWPACLKPQHQQSGHLHLVVSN